jgi:hypothetical protein
MRLGQGRASKQFSDGIVYSPQARLGPGKYAQKYGVLRKVLDERTKLFPDVYGAEWSIQTLAQQ